MLGKEWNFRWVFFSLRHHIALPKSAYWTVPPPMVKRQSALIMGNPSTQPSQKEIANGIMHYAVSEIDTKTIFQMATQTGFNLSRD